MNKNYFKAIAIHLFTFAMVFSICVANSSIIPLIICLIIGWPFSKMINSMSSKEIEWAYGLDFFKSHFENNPIINDMYNE